MSQSAEGKKSRKKNEMQSQKNTYRLLYSALNVLNILEFYGNIIEANTKMANDNPTHS